MKTTMVSGATAPAKSHTAPFGWRDLRRDERGMSTVEYIILMVVVVVGAVGTWNTIGGTIKDNLTNSKDDLVELDGKTK